MNVNMQETLDSMPPGWNAESEFFEAAKAYRTPDFSEKAARRLQFPGTQGD